MVRLVGHRFAWLTLDFYIYYFLTNSLTLTLVIFSQRHVESAEWLSFIDNLGIELSQVTKMSNELT